MSTRGVIGVVIDGQPKVTYNHFDSYPEGVGEDVLKEVRRWVEDRQIGNARGLARQLTAVDETATPTAEDWEKFAPYAKTDVSTGKDWYSLLRDTQGDIEKFLLAGVYIDGIDFTGDSLFCEWGYIVDLDNEVLEVYKGFQKDGNKIVGRFANESRDSDSYAQITLVRSFKFSELPENFDNLARDVDIENGGDPAEWE